jgi:CBS domain-containing protein
MSKVGDVMHASARILHVDHRLEEARTRMRRYGQHFLPVVDGDEIVGQIGVADLYQPPRHATYPEGPDKVLDRITGEVDYCFEDDSVEAALQTMRATGSDALVVVDACRRLAGIVTREMIEAGDVDADDEPLSEEAVAEREAVTTGRTHGGESGGPEDYSARPRIRDDDR